MKDFDENSCWSKGNKVQRTLLNLYFHNQDIDTHMNRRKYRKIVNMSNNPRKHMMKQFMNISNNVIFQTFTCFGVDHEALIWIYFKTP